MSCLTVRDLPPRTLYSLKTRAKSNHRSLNGEILSIFEYAVSGSSEFDFIRENRAKRQGEALKAVFGKWEDDRNEAVIVRDIEGARTKGRRVVL